MADNVQAQVTALRSLRAAVTRYAERMLESMRTARRDADALVKRTEEAVRQRKSELDRAMAGLNQAQAALAACQDERQAAGLRAEVAARQRLFAERKQLYGYAQKAAKTASDTRTNLVKVTQTLEATVREQSSAASSTLASIEDKLAEIALPSAAGQAARRALTVVGTVAEISLAAVNTAKFAQTMNNGYVSADGHRATISEIRREETASGQEHEAENEKKRLEDQAGEVPRQ
jgi:hypothetical protein